MIAVERSSRTGLATLNARRNEKNMQTTTVLTEEEFQVLMSTGFFTRRHLHGPWQVYETDDIIVIHMDGHGAIKLDRP